MDRIEKAHLLSATDVEVGAHDIDYHGSKTSIARILWKSYRVVLTKLFSRRTIISFVSIVAIFFLIRHAGDEFNVNGPPCAPDRANPHRVRLPPAPDQAFMSQLWSDLQSSFDTHIPQPSHIDHPHAGDGTPPKSHVGTNFDWTEEQARATRDMQANLIPTLPEYPRGKYHGRGLVMLAGDRYSEYAATSLGVLRELGSRLPVEVWVGHQAEEIPGWCEELEREGMACRRLDDYLDMSVLKHPYQWKVLTMLFSSFEEILFLDADSAPLANPDFVFDAEPYKSKGAILWPDYWHVTASPLATVEIGITDQPDESNQDTMSAESGQIFWNKKTHWKSLLLATFYNYWGYDHYYSTFNNGYAGWGDKDTFPMALQALREDYYMVPQGVSTTFLNGSTQGIAIIQHDPTNLTEHGMLFLHANTVKWSLRKFLCEECEKMPNYPLSESHLVNPGSNVHKHLKEKMRILNIDEFAPHGLDPELLFWTSMEFSACRSKAWATESLCNKVRSHMDQVFGTRFIQIGPNNQMGRYNQICLENPH